MNTDVTPSTIEYRQATDAALSRPLTVREKLLLLYYSILIGVGVCVGTGLIGGWGKWYSIGIPYRLQTEAMLHGHLKLSDSPGLGQIDLAWGRGGVQQVWGLAVPVWRLPFELLARLFGQPAFPDRLALAAALSLLTYALLRTKSLSGIESGLLHALRESPLKVAAIILLILFPPMLSCFRGEFLVYEEAVAYSYIFAVGLFAGLAAFLARPNRLGYGVLCCSAAVTGFLRPTMLAYGLMTLLIAFLGSRFERWRWRNSLLGVAGFGAVTILLLWTNLVRFGSPLEFGYRVQLNTFYELRFDVAYRHEPLFSALRELGGSLFFTQKFNHFDWYATDLVRWQSATPRWRQFYHTTFDATYLIPLLLSWFMAGAGVLRNWRRGLPSKFDVGTLSAAWSFLSIIPLSGFYLRSVAISSRHMLDFAPAIGVGMVGLLWSAGNLELWRRRRLWTWLLIPLFGGWWFWEVGTAKRSIPAARSLTQAEVCRMLKQSHPARPLPNSYRAEEEPDKYGIPLNRRGWQHADGETGSLVVLFVENPTDISIEVSPSPGATFSAGDFQQIEAKVGLESLQLESVKIDGTNTLVTFHGPRCPEYRQGVQVLFLGFANAGNFAMPQSQFQFWSVTWKSAQPNAQQTKAAKGTVL